MNSRQLLVLWFLVVLVSMLAVTVWASLDRNVLVAAGELWADPWGRATLFDAYFAFVAVWLWIAWRERTTVARLVWLVAILLFGNLAIAGYFLKILLASGERDATREVSGLDLLFGRRPEAAR